MSYTKCGAFCIKLFAELRIVHTFASRLRKLAVVIWREATEKTGKKSGNNTWQEGKEVAPLQPASEEGKGDWKAGKGERKK